MDIYVIPPDFEGKYDDLVETRIKAYGKPDDHEQWKRETEIVAHVTQLAGLGKMIEVRFENVLAIGLIGELLNTAKSNGKWGKPISFRILPESFLKGDFERVRKIVKSQERRVSRKKQYAAQNGLKMPDRQLTFGF